MWAKFGFLAFLISWASNQRLACRAAIFRIAGQRGVWLASIVFLIIAHCAPARADNVADFYRGKQVQIVVGYGAGDGYDRYARLLARHLGDFIPGNPSVAVQNMPCAGSLRAAQFIQGAETRRQSRSPIFYAPMALN